MSDEKTKYTRQYDGVSDLVYVRLVEACNLHCAHCFIPANPKRMSINQCYSLPDQIEKFASHGSIINIRWHGGEPTLFGVDRLRKVLHFLEKDKRYSYVHDIQTNLINFDERWAELYHEYFSGVVGVSWDWKVRLMDKDNKESYKDFNSLFFDKLKLVSDSGLKVNLVITVTKEFIKWFDENPLELLSWIDKFSILSIHLEKLTKTGRARDNWETIGVSHREYSSFMIRLFDIYSLAKNSLNVEFMGISPIVTREADIKALRNGAVERISTGCLSGECDTRFHTIDGSGYKFGCSALTSEYDNVNATSSLTLITVEDIAEARSVRVQSCDGCKYKPICSSGCLASVKFDGSGECSGGKMFFSHIENTNENLY
ncbi:radical SAM protein [Photobacterium kishitanii]|uniref:Radical SAM protein n=1 Tax=Photobacterium kishitanii TaxID=318456 RepID=A0A2T3KN26_9GAMM|nr:radical SAM protein [Photobacterium kishitanii]PSV01174.1 radical SAM protein [Photobacterium kishitanii]